MERKWKREGEGKSWMSVWRREWNRGSGNFMEEREKEYWGMGEGEQPNFITF